MGNTLVNRRAFFSSGQETQICRCGTAGRHQNLPGKYALVKYGIHFTPQLWGRATVWMHDVWACMRQSHRTNCVYIYWSCFQTHLIWAARLRIRVTPRQFHSCWENVRRNYIAWTSAVQCAWESNMCKINICKCFGRTKQYSSNWTLKERSTGVPVSNEVVSGFNPGPGAGRGQCCWITAISSQMPPAWMTFKIALL